MAAPQFFNFDNMPMTIQGPLNMWMATHPDITMAQPQLFNSDNIPMSILGPVLMWMTTQQDKQRAQQKAQEQYLLELQAREQARINYAAQEQFRAEINRHRAVLLAQQEHEARQYELEDQMKPKQQFDAELNDKRLALRMQTEDEKNISECENTLGFETDAEKFFVPQGHEPLLLELSKPISDTLDLIKGFYEMFYNRRVHKIPVMRATLAQIALALPAAYEHYAERLVTSEPSWHHVLSCKKVIDLINISYVVRSLSLDPKYKNHPFFTTVHWVEHVAPSEFNSKVDMQPFERDAKCTLVKATIWTLCKWMYKQLRAAVDNCFDVRGKPFIKGRQLGSMYKHSDTPQLWCEKAHWKYLPESDPLTYKAREILELLKESYNLMLSTSTDLSEPYRLRSEELKAMATSQSTKKSKVQTKTKTKKSKVQTKTMLVSDSEAEVESVVESEVESDVESDVESEAEVSASSVTGPTTPTISGCPMGSVKVLRAPKLDRTHPPTDELSHSVKDRSLDADFALAK